MSHPRSTAKGGWLVAHLCAACSRRIHGPPSPEMERALVNPRDTVRCGICSAPAGYPMAEIPMQLWVDASETDLYDPRTRTVLAHPAQKLAVRAFAEETERAHAAENVRLHARIVELEAELERLRARPGDGVI